MRALAVAGVLVVTSALPVHAFSGRGQATRSIVYAEHGMVCAAQPLAVQAGQIGRAHV